MLRGGRIGGIAVLLLLPFVCAAHGAEEPLFLNGVLFGQSSTLVWEGDTLLVPLVDLGPQLGIEVADGAGGTLDLRWRDGRMSVRTSELRAVSGQAYVPLTWLVGLAGGTLRRLGEVVYVETDPAALIGSEASDVDVAVRFDRFVPMQVLEAGSSVIVVRCHHATSDQAYRSTSPTDGPLSRAEIRTNGLGGVDVILTLREIGDLRVRQFETDGFYSISFGIGTHERTESVAMLSEGMRLVETVETLSAGVTRVAYVRVEDWRASYRVTPATPLAGISDPVTVTQLALGTEPELAFGVGQIESLLVIDGVPLCIPEDEVDVLTIDEFGRLSGLRLTVTPRLRVEGASIGIDAVNRPLQYGEAVAYTPGYSGAFAPGVPGQFTVIKLRGGRVVSCFSGAFIDRDATATVIVASGEAGAAFSNVSLGDDARLVCLPVSADGSAPEDAEPLVHAVSIDSMLIRDGQLQESAEPEDAARAWNVLAADVLGGIVFLTIPRDDRSAGVTREELVDIVRALSAPVVDVFILCAGRSTPLVVRSLGYYAFGSGDRVQVALLLQSIAE